MANLHKIAGMESKTSNQEVDLLEVLAKFYSYLRENIFLAIFFPLAGAGIGFFVFATTEDNIESSMMVVTNLLTHPECDFLLTELEKADTFQGVPPEQRAGLVQISHAIISDPDFKGIKDPQSAPNVHIKITLQVRRHELLRVFEQSIITYLEASRPAIRKKYEFHKFYTEMIAEIDQELASLQQFKAHAEPKTLANFLNPSALYTEAVNLTEKRVNYELRLRNSNIFQLVQGFDALSRTTKLSIVSYILAGFGIGVAMLLPVLFIKYFGGYYKGYRQSHQS
jgi:hypothetical protein